MTINILAKIFEHNNWANTKIIELCSKLSDAQLDFLSRIRPHLEPFGSRSPTWFLPNRITSRF